VRHLIERGDHDVLLSELLRPERPLPLAVRLRLSGAERLDVVASGLACGQVSRLTFRPSKLGVALASRVVEGSGPVVGGVGGALPAASALVGLSAFLEQSHLGQRLGAGAADLAELIEAAEEVARRAEEVVTTWLEQTARLGKRALTARAADIIALAYVLSFGDVGARTSMLAHVLQRLDGLGLGHDRALGSSLRDALMRVQRTDRAAALPNAA